MSEAEPGRTCPLHYHYGPAVFADAPARRSELLYVVRGLYGNLPALQQLLALFEQETGPRRLVFNGDFNWFNIEPALFEAVNTQVLQHDALRGNVETELAGDDSAAGLAQARRHGLEQGGVHIDAIALDSTTPEWRAAFLRQWPAGSDAHAWLPKARPHACGLAECKAAPALTIEAGSPQHLQSPNMQETPPSPPTEPQAEPAAADEAAAQPSAESVAAPAAQTPVAAVESVAADAPAPEAAAAPKPADLPPAECGALLAQHFPALFGAGRALPIKLRVQADIQQRVPGVFSRKSLSIFLHRHTTSTPYIKALLASPHRFDLDGQPAGEVAEEHRAAASAELERRQAIAQARRAADREALNAARRNAPRAAPAGATGKPVKPDAPGRGSDNAPGRGHPPHHGAGGARPDTRPGRSPDRSTGQPPRPARAEGRREDRRPPKPAPETARPPRSAASEPASSEPTAPLSPEQAAEQEARRSRAAVLRAFETTTLTRANFCALKGMSDAALEAILVQARADRGPVKKGA